MEACGSILGDSWPQISILEGDIGSKSIYKQDKQIVTEAKSKICLLYFTNSMIFWKILSEKRREKHIKELISNLEPTLFYLSRARLLF